MSMLDIISLYTPFYNIILAWNPLLAKKEVFPIIMCTDILYMSLAISNNLTQLIY